MARSKIVDESEVIRWFEEERTYPWMQAQYLEKYGIETTIPMWSAFRRRRGLDRRNLRADDLIPWKVKDEHRHLYPALMLRAEGRRRAQEQAKADGKTPKATISDRDAKRLASWKRMLEADGLVVHYDPDTEDGFFYVPREEHDAELIRRPKSTTGNKARD
ncbi:MULTISPECIES: hypothetical protein [Streptomyces]|uniref:hypothetical protein n=1 Tax=Streptomyces TaxID=1883 RepID=UPI002E0E7761|nr:hypothetical protein OG324_32135 [Streptomyces sp. NBC_01236]